MVLPLPAVLDISTVPRKVSMLRRTTSRRPRGRKDGDRFRGWKNPA